MSVMKIGMSTGGLAVMGAAVWLFNQLTKFNKEDKKDYYTLDEIKARERPYLPILLGGLTIGILLIMAALWSD